MARDRDWVDYANLASNIAQNVQLRGVQLKLGDVASAIREQTSTAERESRLRDAVFHADTLLRNLNKISKANPRAATAWARQALMQFEREDVTSASFRSYDDKERLRSVVEACQQMVQECSAALSPDERSQVERCGHYLMERNELKLLVRLAQKREELDRLEAQFDGLYSKTGFQLISIGLVIGLSGFVPRWIASNLAPELGEQNGYGLVALCMFGVGGVLFLVGMGLTQKDDAAKNKVVDEIRALKKSESLIDPSLGFFDALSKRFGGIGSAELLKMQVEREALIAEVVGGTVSGLEHSEDRAAKEG